MEQADACRTAAGNGQAARFQSTGAAYQLKLLECYQVRGPKLSLLVICPKRFEDSRGWFSETWKADHFAKLGLPGSFCQENESWSRSTGTLRGLHFQASPHAQSKLIRCLKGRIFDVVVDIRRGSPSFGKWLGLELAATDGQQLFVPAGFAHGYLTLEDECIVNYKVDLPYAPSHEMGVAWNDPTVGIEWPIADSPILSEKDASLPLLGQVHDDFPYDGVPLSLPAEVVA
jgi:dTDP-4-dehydrorhamnose 3,5-epimerase